MIVQLTGTISIPINSCFFMINNWSYSLVCNLITNDLVKQKQ